MVAEVTASGDVVGADSGSGEAIETTAEADSSSSSSFSYEDSVETVSETRPEVGLDKVGPTEVPEVGLGDPFIAQFGEDDGWWWNMVDFVRREAEGDARNPPDYWQEQIPRDEVQASGPRRDAS